MIYSRKTVNELILSSVLLLLTISVNYVKCNEDWAVEITGGDENAKRIAKEYNMEYMGPVGGIPDIYHFRMPLKSLKRVKREAIDHTNRLKEHKEIKWVEHQKILKRSKRNIKPSQNQIKRETESSEDLSKMFNDPQWPNQWYLYDTRSSDTIQKHDMHVLPVWKMNYTGRGVKVTIIDDGIEHTHPEIQQNYDPICSYDLNDNDEDPMPNTDPGTNNQHGTRCASEVAMVANNNFCGVGIAYNCKIGGIRLLDGPVSDLLEAKSIAFRNDYIDIYSSSWGPMDDGKEMGRVGRLATKALELGITKGRGGKGNLYVWASGNGGYLDDNCACDGYVSSRYTISVSSIEAEDKTPEYNEKCPSIMAVTYSSSGYNSKSKKLITADINGKCTDKHSGTSASAPIAAGIFALALEANKNLTWRDIKHLLAWTSQYSNIKYISNWKKNKAGFYVNDKLGFGLIDAKNLVTHAQKWINVGPEISCTVAKQINQGISSKSSVKLSIEVNRCDSIKFIEHVVVITTVSYSKRGALTIKLKSPESGHNTTLLYARINDDSDIPIQEWPFSSVHQWGETPNGNWTMYFEEELAKNPLFNKDDSKMHFGIVKKIELIFYGTANVPEYIRKFGKNDKRIYNENYNKVFNRKRRGS